MERELGVPQPQLEFPLESVSTNRTEVAPWSNVVLKDFQRELVHREGLYIWAATRAPLDLATAGSRLRWTSWVSRLDSSHRRDYSVAKSDR